MSSGHQPLCSERDPPLSFLASALGPAVWLAAQVASLIRHRRPRRPPASVWPGSSVLVLDRVRGGALSLAVAVGTRLVAGAIGWLCTRPPLPALGEGKVS